MEKIIQNLVKIIIIGSLCAQTSVMCHSQFFAIPPLPYYHNDDYYLRSVVPPHQDSYPVYYQEFYGPPPISYQNMNTFPQLFHQDENYHPPPGTTTGSYYTPEIYPYKGGFYQPPYPPYSGVKQASYKTPPKPEPTKYQAVQATFKNPTPYTKEAYQTKQSNFQKPPQSGQEKVKNQQVVQQQNHNSNVIQKMQSYHPYYRDDYNKNYQDEEYFDNYSDENTYSDPCGPNSPYKFYGGRTHPTPPGVTGEDKYTLCNPYFQPNLGNSFPALKIPITLLPSRFPPRVEEFIERIQNYFSTYTQNQTSPSTTVQPLTTAASESVSVAEDSNKKNTTGENLGQTNSEQTTVVAINDLEQETAKKQIVTAQNIQIEKKEEPSAVTEADVLGVKDAQTEEQTTESHREPTENPPPASVKLEKFEEKPQEILTTTTTAPSSTTTEIHSNELESTTNPESEVQMTVATDLLNANESASKTEEDNSIPTTSEIYHHVTDNHG